MTEKKKNPKYTSASLDAGNSKNDVKIEKIKLSKERIDKDP
jgi:hypothetical protein